MRTRRTAPERTSHPAPAHDALADPCPAHDALADPAFRIGFTMVSAMPFEYSDEVREELKRHGVVPLETTDPQMVRDWLSGVYKYEIRVLKRRLLAREFPQREYADHVRALRRNYVLLSIPLETWTRRT